MHTLALSAPLHWNVEKCGYFHLLIYFFLFFFASGILWAVARHKERRDGFLLLFASIWSDTKFLNIWIFRGQAIVVDKNLFQLAKSVLQSLKNSFPLSNKTMDTSRCSSQFVMSNITKGYEKKRLNPRWEKVCEMAAEQPLWIGMITFSHMKKWVSEKKTMDKKMEETQKRCCFCSHSYFRSLLSDLPRFCKTSAAESLPAEERHTSQMQRCSTHLTSISIFPSWVVWCLRRQRRPHFCSAGATQVSPDLAVRSISL